MIKNIVAYIVLPLLFVVFTNSLQAQINDNCANAIAISIGTTCVLDTFNSSGATAEPTTVAPNPGCGFYQGGDVWFTAAVPASGGLQFEFNGIGFNPQWALYAGNCGSFTQITCSQLNNKRTVDLSSFATQTIYLRVYGYNSAAGGTFSLCVYEPTLPANNNCANALPLTVGNSCTMGNYTNEFSTPEDVSVAPNPTCGGYGGADVWFTTVVPPSGVLRIEKTTNFSQIAIYTGTCGSFTQLTCFQLDNNKTLQFPAQIGQTIYIRAFAYGNDAGGPFTICLWEPTLPTNNNCTDAIALNVGNSCTIGNYTTAYATPEGVNIAPNPTCGGYNGADVWFTAVVPASGALRIEKTTNFSQIAIYSGTCGSFTQLTCFQLDDTKTLLFPAQAGQTIYIRAFAYGNDEGGDFTICLWEPTLPTNNNCADAIALNVGNSCTIGNYTTAYATPEGVNIAPNPTCGGYNGADVWFTAVVPASGALRIEKTTNFSQIAIYSGTCGSFTQLTCFQLDDTKTLLFPAQAGQTIYIRAFAYGNDEGGDFTICLWEPTLPANNNCLDAIALNVGNSCNFTTYTNDFATPEDISIAANPSCGAFRGADVWFTAVVPASGALRIEKTTNFSQTTLYTGTCGNFTPFLCLQLNNEKTILIPSLAGQTIYIRVYAYSNDDGGDFDLCVWEPIIPANDNCANAIELPVGTTCMPDTFSNAYATNDTAGTAPNPTCGAYDGGDVWFTIKVPATGNLLLERANIANVNAQYALYEGSCGGFTQLRCAQLTSSIYISDTSLAGDTLYLRVFNYSNEEGGVFSLCAYDTTCNLANNTMVRDTICFGDTLVFGTQTLTSSGVYNEVFPAAGGCDSTVQLILFIHPYSLQRVTDAVCTGDSYTFPSGTTVNNISTTIIDTSILTSSIACDSTIITTVNVNSIITRFDTASVCSGDSYTFPDGGTASNITASINDTSLLTSASACDSVIITTINVNSIYTRFDTASVCLGDSYTFPDGGTASNITVSINDTSLLTSASACDSIIITTVNVNSIYTRYDTTSVCSGDSYTFPDGGTATNITASLNDTSLLTSSTTCDSIIITTVNVNSIYTRFDTASVCSGDSYNFPDGGTATNITVTINDTSLLTSASACDSIIITTVNVNSIYTRYDTASVCPGDSYTFPDGGTATNITVSINDTSLLTSASACDSVIITTVNVNSIYTRFDTASVCSGDSYTFPDGGMASNITTSINDTSLLTSASSCDSVIITTVNVNSIYTRFDTASVCSGDSYTFPDGGTATNITASINDTSSISSSVSCDSLIFTTIVVNSVYAIYDTVAVCNGESYTFPSGMIANNITNPINDTSSLNSTSGCDSTIYTYIAVYNHYIQHDTVELCSGADYTFADGDVVTNLQSSLIDTAVVSTIAACDSMVITVIFVTFIDTSTSQTGPNLSVSPTPGASYQWIDCNADTIITGAEFADYTATENGSYAVEITSKGCIDTTTCMTVTGIGIYEEKLTNVSVAPNPNEGSFVINLGQVIPNAIITITDLVGKQVYHSKFDNSSIKVATIDGAVGVYLVHISTPNESITIKIAKQ